MKCPNCQHRTSNTALLQCSQCGEAFERNLLEEYEHLEYLSIWLSLRSEISLGQIKQLTNVVQQKQTVIRAQLLRPIEGEKPVETKSVAGVEAAEMPQPVQAVADVTASPAQQAIVAPQVDS